MGAEPFFQLLGALFLLLWNILKLVFNAIFWLVTLGTWKLDEARFNTRTAAEKAALDAAEQRRQTEILSRNTLYGRQE